MAYGVAAKMARQYQITWRRWRVKAIANSVISRKKGEIESGVA